MAFGEVADLAVRLSLEGNFNAEIGRAEGSLNRLNGSVGKLGSKIGNDLGQGIRNTARNLERLAFIAGGLAIGGGAAAVKWAGDFQAGMNTINTVSQESVAVLGKAGEGIRSIFRETGQSLSDLQQGEYDLVSAGIKLTSAQDGLNAAVKLGIGGLGTTAQAVDVLTTAVNAYNLKAADGSVATETWTKLSDELAQAVSDGKVTLDQIAASYANVAAVASQAGIGTNEIAAAYGFLTAKGVPAAEVTTQMSRAIVELLKPNAELIKLQKQTKVNFADVAREKGLNVALEQMRVAAEKAGIPFIDLFGRLEGYKFALQTTGDNAAGFATELDNIAHSAGETKAQFDERAQGLNYQLGRLKANVQDAGITIGTQLLPVLTDLANDAANFLVNHRDAITAFGKDLAKGLRDAVTWAKSLDWNAIGTGLKAAAGFVSSLVQGLTALPTEVKGLLLGLYGLNKLSGGAVVNIGVDIAKGAFGAFLGRGSPINPMYVVPVGGGLGGAAASGGMGLAASAFGLAAAAALTVAIAVPLGEALRNAFGVGAGDKPKTIAEIGGFQLQVNGQSQAQEARQRIIDAQNGKTVGGALSQGAPLPVVIKNASGDPAQRDEIAARKKLASIDEQREANRIAAQQKQSIDYAKVATTSRIDTTTEAIRTSQAAIVAAIAGMKLSVNIGAGTITTAQVTAGNYNNPSTLNRGTPPPVRPGQAPVAS